MASINKEKIEKKQFPASSPVMSPTPVLEIDENKRRYEDLWNNAPVAYHILNKEGVIIQVNKTEADMLGYSASEMIGKSIFDFIHLEQRTHARQRFALKIKGESVSRAENRVYFRKDGSHVHVSINDVLEKDSRGAVVGVRTTMMDITEKHHMEVMAKDKNRQLKMFSLCNEALVYARNEEKLLKEICGIIVKTGGYKFAWVGQKEMDKEKTVKPVAQVGLEEGYLEQANISWSPKNPRGRGPTGRAVYVGRIQIGRFFSEDKTLAPWRKEALKRGYASSIALPLKIRKKVFGALNIYSSNPDAFEKNEVELLLDLADDLAFGVTTLRVRQAHREAEDKLRESEEKYRDLVEHSSSIILRMDAQGNITFFNEFAEKFFGYSEEELLGRNIVGTITPKSETTGRDLSAIVEDIIRHSRRYAYNENENVKKNGERIWVAWTNKLIYNRKRKLMGILSVGNDITDRKKKDERLVESYRQVGMINRKISLLLEVEQFSQKQRGNKKKEAVKEYILNTAMNLSNASTGLLFSYSEENNNFSLLHNLGVQRREKNRMRVLPCNSCKFFCVLAENKMRLQGAMGKDEAKCFRFEKNPSYFLTLPLVRENKLKGMIFLGFDETKNFSTQEEEFFDVFSMHAANALLNCGVLG